MSGAAKALMADMRVLRQKKADLLQLMKKRTDVEAVAGAWANPYMGPQSGGGVRQNELFRAAVNGDVARCTALLQHAYISS